MSKFDQLYNEALEKLIRTEQPRVMLNARKPGDPEYERAEKMKDEAMALDPTGGIWSGVYNNGQFPNRNGFLKGLETILKGHSNKIEFSEVTWRSGGPILHMKIGKVDLFITYFKTNKFMEFQVGENWMNPTGDIAKAKVAKEAARILNGLLSGKQPEDMGYKNYAKRESWI